MQVECFPISALPGTSALFRDYAEAADAPTVQRLRQWYPHDPFRLEWARSAPVLPLAHRERLADALRAQTKTFAAGAAALENIDLLRQGAAAVVTGQQVGLFGGPLLTLLKAATAIRQAQEATRVSGRPHVPVFWLASEDHDVAEVDRIDLLSKAAVERITTGLHAEGGAVPAGSLRTADHVEAALARVEELLAYAPICETLRAAYTDQGASGDHGAYNATMASAFGRVLSQVFAAQGLVVVDASAREFHALGQAPLRAALEHSGELEEALMARSKELEAAGYHAQVKVGPEMSLLFLISPGLENGAEGSPERRALRRNGEGAWKAGNRIYSTGELLAILETEPERLSPNALLRPVFQDAIFPTAAYIGGPAEIAYFAQSAVVYERVLGRVTPVLPRLSATLVEPSIAAVLQRHEVQFPQLLAAKTAEELALRLGARAMPIEAKRKLAEAGNALDRELEVMLAYMGGMSADLGRAAGVSANKMRYQMNRLRRMAARFQVERETSLGKQAATLMLHLFPEQHLQERLLGGVWFLARYGDSLPQLLVDHAGQECPGHRVIFLP